MSRRISDQNRSNRRKFAILRTILLCCVALVCVVGVIVLSSDVRRKLDALAGASSDNVQWSLSQVEVEVLQLEIASQLRPENPTLVREKFDIFYSRVQTLGRSDVYDGLRSDPGFAQSLNELQTFLEQSLVMIDGPDEALINGLPVFFEQIADVQPQVRRLSLRGIELFAQRSDIERESVADTLLRIAGLTLGLVITLIILVVTLIYFYQQMRRRSNENHMTSARLESVLSTSLDAILVMDSSGIVRSFNAVAEQIFGYTADEANGSVLSELIIPEHMRDAHDNGMKRYNKSGEPRVSGAGRLMLDAQRKDGTVFPVEVAINAAQSDDDEIFVSFIRDVSDRVLSEKQLLKARDDALAGEKAKADLLAVMSHEMRTPLNGLLGTMELLEGTNLTDRQAAYLDIMNTSGNLLLHHVNDVLDISRLDAGKMDIEEDAFEPTALFNEIVESQRSVAIANGNELDLIFSVDAPEVALGDPVRLRQILLNLIGNANKFTRSGTVRVNVTPNAGAGQLVVAVTDTGIGIAPEDIERIFGDFVTLDATFERKVGGTGLGLGIATRLVSAMGGKLTAESVLGEGSTFTLTIPMVFPAGARAKPREVRGREISSEPNAPMDILLVEDNRINRVVARDMLEQQGHTVTEAHDGDEGVVAAGQRKYDLILMDISMPRMSGIEATLAIRSGQGASQAAPIIALTAHALPRDIERFLDAGMNDTLIKPISMRSLNDVIARIDHKVEPVTALDISDDLMLVDTAEITALKSSLPEDVYASLLTEYFEETDQALAMIEVTFLTADTVKSLSAMVHKLAGSAAIFANQKFATSLKAAQTAGDSGDLGEMQIILDRLPELWRKTRDALNAL